MERGKLLVKNAQQLVKICGNKETMLIGEAMQKIDIMNAENGSGLSIAVNRDGNITDIGSDEDINSRYESSQFDDVIDASGCCVIPGLIDAHTHPVWAGDRVHEFSLKLAGASYMEVHKAGGGIHYTVEQTRNSSEDQLYDLFKQRLLRMIKCGTTLAECKSGYGLNTEHELKMLRVIERSKQDDDLHIDISSTFCGAHAVPKGKSAEEATCDVIDHQLPAVAKELTSGRLSVDNIDVFCELGVFDVDQTRRILREGSAIGLNINFHGDELHPMKAAEMGSSLAAKAISHLEDISEEGIRCMAQTSTVAVILPTTAYILRLAPPPVRAMIENGVPVALGTDFNPNAYCLSMPTTMHLACVNLRMSMEEALVASTINAAASLGRSHSHGSIEIGKRANLVLLKASRWEHLIYQFAGHDDVIAAVVCGGSIAYKRECTNQAVQRIERSNESSLLSE